MPSGYTPICSTELCFKSPQLAASKPAKGKLMFKVNWFDLMYSVSQKKTTPSTLLTHAVDDSTLKVDSQPKFVGLVWRLATTCCGSTFIRWTGCTLCDNEKQTTAWETKLNLAASHFIIRLVTKWIHLPQCNAVSPYVTGAWERTIVDRLRSVPVQHITSTWVPSLYLLKWVLKNQSLVTLSFVSHPEYFYMLAYLHTYLTYSIS